MLKNDQANVHYSESGIGPTLIFIHGWSHSSKIWNKLTSVLSKYYRCVCLDLPGFGVSKPLNKNEINLDSYTVIINSFLIKISEFTPIHGIISDSLGAIITLKILEIKDICCSKVLLCGCPIDGLPTVVKYLQRGNVISVLLNLMKITPFPLVGYLIKKFLYLTAKNPTQIEKEVIRDIYNLDVYSANRLLYELTSPTYFNYNELRKLPIRYCIVRGAFDRVISKKSSAYLAKQLNSKCIEIDNAGHTPMQESPDLFLNILNKFLTDK